MLSVRLAFSKTGAVKYISHLDLNRTLVKALVRAEMPLAYSEGFNPRPKIGYASSLSLGVESFAEFADIKMATESNADLNTMLERLNSQLPAGITAVRMYIPESDFKEISYAKYSIYIASSDLNENIAENYFANDILIEKKTKTKTVIINIKESIKTISFNERDSDGYCVIDTTLAAGIDNYLNPEYIVRALKNISEIDDHYIIKKQVYDSCMNIFQ